MPPTDYQESSSSPSQSPFSFSILSRRRDQVHSMEESNGGHDSDLEAFQRTVADRFHDVAAAPSDELLSIPWIRKLLDAFLSVQEEFRVIVFNHRSSLSKPPIDKQITDFFERSVKALDVCNAIRDGIDQIRHWQKQLEIVLSALDNQRSIGEGQFRRAKKALIDLTIAMLDDNSTAAVSSHRNRSFGRQSNQPRSMASFRSLSWSVSRTWSAARQLQAVSSSLAPPRANETAATNGLNIAVYTMSYVLLFTMWALVAAIPCQDRGLPAAQFFTRQFAWAPPISSLYERITEESKRRDRRNTCGLMKEIHEIEKCVRLMNELTDSVGFPLTEERENQVKQRVDEIGRIYEAIKEGLDPLERLVREAFRRIVRSRTEGLDSIARANAHE